MLAGLVAGAVVITAAMAPAAGVSPCRPAAAVGKQSNASLNGVAAVSRSNVWAFGCKFAEGCVSALIGGPRYTGPAGPALEWPQVAAGAHCQPGQPG